MRDNLLLPHLIAEEDYLLTLEDLLEDPKYKEFFCKVPKLLNPSQKTKPWRVFIQLKKDRKWRKKDFYSYTSAFKFLRKLIQAGVVQDATIHCLRQSYSPPTRVVRVKGKFLIGSDGKRRQVTRIIKWEPQLDVNDPNDYTWCPYCRRPTVFKYYAKHHAIDLKGLPIDQSVARCHICGVSTRMLTNYKVS